MRYRVFALAVAGFLVVASFTALVLVFIGKQHLRNLETTCERIGRWAKEQPLAPGSYPQIGLPAAISPPPGSQVNVVKTSQGDIVVLLKTDIGWKENYDGVLFSTRPLSPADVSKDYYGREQVEIPGIDSSRPVIKERITPQFFRVYFDLG